MTVTCGFCRERYDDADCVTLCPHALIMPRGDLEQKKLAITLLGKEVRFAHQEVNPTWYRITSMGWNGMLTLDGLPGEFAPHLFVAAGKIEWK